MIKKYYLETLIITCFIIILIKIFYLDYFVVSSESMENTLKAGNIVFVNKINDSYSYEDIVVFKISDYENKVIKRIIALPNDTLKINNTQTFINNCIANENRNIVHQYKYFDSEINNFSLKSISNLEYFNMVNKKDYLRYIVSDSIKFFGHNWTLDNFGPIWIPQKGKKIIITDQNFSIYQHILEQETTLEYVELINKPYEFKNDYYFLIGDNRHNSRDSRYYGLISKSKIVGKYLFHF